jgi:hypothetical protein
MMEAGSWKLGEKNSLNNATATKFLLFYALK